MVIDDIGPALEPASLPVDPDTGPDAAGILFAEDVRRAGDVWLARFEQHTYPVFERHGYSRDTALLVFMSNLLYSGICDIRDNTRDAADLLQDDAEDDWGPGARPAG